MVMIPGAGAIRSLVVSLRLDDGGFAPGMAAANTRTDATAASMAAATHNVYAMRAQLAILGFTASAVMGKMLKDAADFEKEMNVAAFAALDLDKILKKRRNADGTISVEMDTGEFDRDFAIKAKNVRSDAMKLSKELALDPQDSMKLIRQVQQFGLGDAVAAMSVARAGAKLNIATGGEIAADKSALAIYKLLKSSYGEVDASVAQRADLMAEYINIAAQESSADPAQIERFLRRFQIVGTATNMTPEQVVAMTAAITDLDSGGREYFSSSVLRQAAVGFKDKRERLKGFLGMDEEEYTNIEADTATLLMRIGAQLKANEQNTGKRIIDQMSELGLSGNVRDTLADTTAALAEGKYQQVLDKLRGRDLSKGLLIDKQVEIMLGSLAGRWDALMASMKRVGIVMGTTFGQVLTPVMVIMTDFFNMLADHPALAAAVGFGALTLVLAKMVTMFRAAKGAATDFLGIITGIGARMYGPTRGVAYSFAGMGYGHHAMRALPGSGRGGRGGRGSGRGGAGGASAMGSIVGGSKVYGHMTSKREMLLPVTVSKPKTRSIKPLDTKGTTPIAPVGKGSSLYRAQFREPPMPKTTQTRFPSIIGAPALPNFKRVFTAPGRSKEPPLSRFTPPTTTQGWHPLALLPGHMAPTRPLSSDEKHRLKRQQGPRFRGPKWMPPMAPQFLKPGIKGQTNLLGAAAGRVATKLPGIERLSRFDTEWKAPRTRGVGQTSLGAFPDTSKTGFLGELAIAASMMAPGMRVRPKFGKPVHPGPISGVDKAQNLAMGRRATMQTKTSFKPGRSQAQIIAGQQRNLARSTDVFDSPSQRSLQNQGQPSRRSRAAMDWATYMAWTAGGQFGSRKLFAPKPQMIGPHPERVGKAGAKKSQTILSHMASNAQPAHPALLRARGHEKAAKWGALEMAGMATMFTPFGKIGRVLKKLPGLKAIGGGVRAGGMKARGAAGQYAGDAYLKKLGRLEMKGAKVGTFSANFGSQGAKFLGSVFGKKTGGRMAASMATRVGGRATMSALGVATGPIGLIALATSLLANPLNNLGNTLMNMGKNIGGPIGFIVKVVGLLSKTLSLLGNAINWIWDQFTGLLTKLKDKFVEHFPKTAEAIGQAGHWLQNVPDQIASGIDDANKALTDNAAESVAEAAKKGDEAGRTLGDGLVRAQGGRRGAGGTYILNQKVEIKTTAPDYFNRKGDINGMVSASGSRFVASTQG